jgi:hypothetical protein
MTFNFNKAATLINELSRTALGRFFIKQNKSRKVVAVNQHYQENPAGGMFGQLVTRDATHRQYSNGDISRK